MSNKLDTLLERGANIATILGVLGLGLGIFSIFHELSMQRQESARVASEQTIQHVNELRLAFMENRGLVDAVIKGMTSFCPLTKTEQFQFENYLQYLFYSAHAQFRRVVETRKDIGLWEKGTKPFLKYLIHNKPGVNTWWADNYKFGFTSQFVDEVGKPLKSEDCGNT